ncbi:CoA transferase, partial [Bradyrhizobium sp.]|uniref:CoA transferase n=1 Tax=Bradyrhizobium sp. TaxID=376 RepID=UPI003C756E6A
MEGDYVRYSVSGPPSPSTEPCNAKEPSAAALDSCVEASNLKSISGTGGDMVRRPRCRKLTKNMVDLLKGIRVLSFNHFLMGPVGVQFLADLGADVIAVEPPDGAFQRKWGGADKQVDGQTMLLLAGNRNKRSLTLDLKQPEAITIAKKLIATSDVIAENFRPGVLDKLGLGFEEARRIKKDIIY